MARFLALLYGVVAYALFVGAFLHAVVFVTGLPVAKTIDTGPVVPVEQAIIIDMLLMGLFAVQHSVMARKGFKRWWTQFVSPPVERATYVLFATLALMLLLWQWRPIPTIVWETTDPTAALVLTGISLFGWVFVLASTFMINHFELFGLHQVVNNLVGRDVAVTSFKTPMFYKLVRHPIYLGFIIAFWATPVMTAGHFLFAAVTTAYILVGIMLEERDLVDQFGDEYRDYRESVGMLTPKIGRAGAKQSQESTPI
jgi:protein-S-isoprenylcysteine O-methyltransferase Ste14